MSPGIDHSANSQRQPHINNTITQLGILALSQPFNLVITHWENVNSVIANLSLLLTSPSTCQAGGGQWQQDHHGVKGSATCASVSPICSPTVPCAWSWTWHQRGLRGCEHGRVSQGAQLGRRCAGVTIVVTQSRGQGRAGLWYTGGVRAGVELGLRAVGGGI